MAPDALIEEIDAAARAPDRDHATAPAGAVGERVVLLASSAALAGQVPAEGVTVDRLPFAVGRRPAEDERRRGGAMRLELEDGAPYRLSRRHFAIVAADGALAVRDDHSTLGTVVNEEAVGEQFPRSEAPLRRGENLVVAGGPDSPFAFQLVVGWRLPRPPHRIWMLCAETPADSPSRVGG